MDIVSRLVAFRDFKELSNSQFADTAGIPRPTLSQFLNGRNKRLSDDLTAKIHSAFPELNILWLLFGEGDMLIDENIEISEGKNDISDAFLEPKTADNQTFTDIESTQTAFINQRQNSTIGAETAEFGKKDSSQAFKEQPSHPLTVAPTVAADPAKKIQSIMVFYSDSSFEIFTPGGEK